MIRFFIILILLGVFLGCKTSEGVRFSSEKEAAGILLEKLSDISIDYTLYSAKARVHLKTPDMAGGGRMNIRMIKDSLVWFNFKKLSIEGARGLIQPDSFCIVYRLDKMYEKGDVIQLFEYYDLPLNFSELQYYIAGNIPMPSPTSLDYDKTSDGHRLTGMNEEYNLEYTFNNALDLESFTLSDNTGRKLSIALKNKDEENGIYLGRQLSFPYDEENTGILDINLSNIEIDVPKEIRFSVPAHYSRY